jgi:predicted Zn-dependent protease
MQHRFQGDLIEVGWVIVGHIEGTDKRAVLQSRDTLLAYCRDTFDAFTWQMPLIEREGWGLSYPAEPAALLEYGMIERDVRHWDFVFMVTDIDLASHYKPYTFGVLSRSVDISIMSTARLDPQAAHLRASTEERCAAMSRRLCALALHLFGHLNGLLHHDDPHGYMYDIQTVEDLDRMTHFPAEQVQRLESNLREVADLRLEEESTTVKTHRLVFYGLGIWRGRMDILRAIQQAKPWQFPFRLSRLTTAAVSALVVLLMTAEAWELGMSQSPQRVMILSCGALAITSVYILRRQGLLMRREMMPLSEQVVATNVSVIAVVCLGMLTTYGLLLLGALVFSILFFQPALVAGWAASLHGAVSTRHYLILSAFLASFGLLIGALGASFEQYYYFRHVTYIDEEA